MDNTQNEKTYIVVRDITVQGTYIRRGTLMKKIKDGFGWNDLEVWQIIKDKKNISYDPYQVVFPVIEKIKKRQEINIVLFKQLINNIPITYSSNIYYLPKGEKYSIDRYTKDRINQEDFVFGLKDFVLQLGSVKGRQDNMNSLWETFLYCMEITFIGNFDYPKFSDTNQFNITYFKVVKK
jgi:hypothetical protein